MPRLKWLILDANSVITLHELGIWSQVAGRCDVHLARTVVESEAVFFEKDGDRQPIDDCQESLTGCPRSRVGWRRTPRSGVRPTEGRARRGGPKSVVRHPPIPSQNRRPLFE
jgi:hypothetical protein